MDTNAPSFHLQIQPPVLAQPEHPEAVRETPARPTSAQRPRKLREKHSCLLLEKNSATFVSSDLSYPNSQDAQSSPLLVGKRHQLPIKGSYRNNLYRKRPISRFKAHHKQTPEPLAFGKALRGRHCHLVSTQEKGLGKTSPSPYRQPKGDGWGDSFDTLLGKSNTKQRGQGSLCQEDSWEALAAVAVEVQTQEASRWTSQSPGL